MSADTAREERALRRGNRISTCAAVASLSWLLCVTSTMLSAATITFTTAKMVHPSGDVFRLELEASGAGVQVGSYGMRTYKKTTDTLPGFASRNGFLYRVFESTDPRLRHMLIDNGPADEDAGKSRVAMTVPVAGWPDGHYVFLVYADNRPAGGAYVSARRQVLVTVRDGKVAQSRSGTSDMVPVKITRLSIEPEQVTPGVPVRISFDIAGPVDEIEAKITTPYTVGPAEVPPGFDYDAESRFASYPRDGTGSSYLLDTENWRPGVVHLSVSAAVAGTGGSVAAYRDFAVQVDRPQRTYDVTVESDVLLCAGTHFGTMVRMPDGAVRAHGLVTRDGGRSWKREGRVIPMGHVLKDGTIIGLGMRSKPVLGQAGVFHTQLLTSTDGGRTVSERQATVHVPDAVAGIGHAPAPGPLFWRSIVERPDGSLLAAMYGWFEGDDSPVPGQSGSMRYRTFVVESTDGGSSWRYLSTVAYDPDTGTEGYCEPVIRLLPNGTLCALLRTGGNNRPFWQDNPLCVTFSADGGVTWVRPVRTGHEGVSPDLCVMSDGALACSYGRPGADLMFSVDRGRTWIDPVCVDPERYSGYTALCELEPGVLLYGYGAMKRLDPDTGERRNEIRVARLRVRKREL